MKRPHQSPPYQKKSGIPNISSRLAILLLIAVTIGLLAPFANKAFNIDEPLFVWTARQIQAHPLNFYGFNVNWYGQEMRMADVSKNPPLASYYLACAAMISGWGEVALHLAFLLPAIGAVAGAYFLARQFCSQPVLVSLITAVSPVFLVSSSSVMCDTLTLAFWVWAIFFWLRGFRRRRWKDLVVSSIFIALCSLTKYVGMALLPLLAVYSFAQCRRLGAWAWHLLIPVIVLAGYQWYTFHLYGHGFISDAESYARTARAASKTIPFFELLVGLSFLGACVAPAVFFIPWLWKWRQLSVMAGITLAWLVVTLASGQLGHFSLTQKFPWNWKCLIGLDAVFVFSGVSLCSLAVADVWRRRDAESLLLFLWMAGVFVFASFVNWTVNGRSLLPLAPSAAILVVRRLEQSGGLMLALHGWKRLLPLIPAGCFGLMILWGDFCVASTPRLAAEEVERDIGSRRQIWFEGHWGFQYYMEQRGAVAVDSRNMSFAEGDIVVIPLFGTNFQMLPKTLKIFRILEFRTHPLFTTMAAGSGFYADVFGPLPFAWAFEQSDNYAICEVQYATNPIH